MRPAFWLLCALLSCADESAPATWVKRLDDPARRVAAIERLERFDDEAHGSAAVRVEIVVPLTRTYVAGGFDAKIRAELLRRLAAMHDPRTSPALASALEACSDDDAKNAAEGIALMLDPTKLDRPLADSLWRCFAKYAPSKGSTKVSQALHDAVLAVRDRSYGSLAVALLAAPVSPAESLDERGVRKVNDPLDFWQPTAIEVLGALRETSAVKPLVVVLMTRNKLGLTKAAKNALLEMPLQAEPVLAAALDGSDPDLAKLRAEWLRDDAYIAIVLDALAGTSLDSAKDAVLAAIPTLTTAANRAAAAEALTSFPTTPKIVEIYRAIYATLPPVAHEGDTGIERAALLQRASDLFVAEMGPWALSAAAPAKGEALLAAKASAIQTALKLMGPDEKTGVADAIDILENHSGLSRMERSEVAGNLDAIFASASLALVCGKDASCYVKILDETIPNDSHANYKAIKAAYMCGTYGDDKTRKELVARVVKVTNPGVRHAMVLAINHLAPHGDLADAKTLEMVPHDDEVTLVSHMLRARALGTLAK